MASKLSIIANIFKVLLGFDASISKFVRLDQCEFIMIRNLILLFLTIFLSTINLFGQESNQILLTEETPSFFQKLMADPYLFIIIALLLVCIIVLGFFNKLSGAFISAKTSVSDDYLFDINEMSSTFNATKNVIKFLTFIIPGFYLVYVAVNGTSSQGHIMEWLNLIVRWVHVVAGVMWIGASFYFIFLENNLNRTEGVRDELAGNLWAIHGGGFYFLEKYKVAPKQIPKDLHWFKYEAYFTWLSGFALLWVVYYMDAKAYLLDASVSDINSIQGIAIGIGTMIFGWLIYDFMCKSPLIKNTRMFGIIGMILLIGISYFLTHVFSGRAAFIHVGALIGTIMAWNVYFVIIPSQKALVKAAVTGKPLDPTLGQKAGQRSLHNNYFTLPLIFIMISNHFPSTFGHGYNWIILMVITLASAGIKHYWNLLERKIKTRYILPVSVIALLSLALVTSPMFEKEDLGAPVSYSEVEQIMINRCVQCHSESPTDDTWKAAPNGVMFDTPEQVKNMVDKIMTRAVRSNSMPQGNKTNMTDEERLVLKRWILQGAKTNE